MIQGSEEWLRTRWGKVGGSRAKGLFIDSETLLTELVAEHIEEFELEDEYESADMIRGNELEPLARQFAEEYLGLKFNTPAWIQSTECEIIGISPDGLTEDGLDALEIKCPARKKHTATILSGEVPSDNIRQVIHYFTVCPELQRVHFVSFRPECTVKRLFVKTVNRSDSIALGTKAKPIVKTVGEWAAEGFLNAKHLHKLVLDSVDRLRF